MNNNTKKFNIPRLVIGATGSGAGKTTITCAILMALKKRNLDICSFKCGPDYIDPMFHRKVMNISSTNLDLFFTDKETTLTVAETTSHGKDMAIVEGVMGYYDGIRGTTTLASTYDLAKTLDAPTILIVGGKGKSLSLLAEIKGFLEFQKDSNIKGVIINGISKSMYMLLKDQIESQLNIKALGYFPIVENASLESRHLGLVTAGEVKNLGEILEILGNQAEESLDIDGIISLGKSAKNLIFNIPNQLMKFKKISEEISKKPINLAIAKDEAFCFYYEENLKILEYLGCNLIEVSPLRDRKLPENVDGILLGGGYPELYGRELSENISFREDLKERLISGMPCLGECGGFMYLHEFLEDREGNIFPMIGLLPGKVYPLEKMNRFGYINIKFEKNFWLGNEDFLSKGHEFHYWESENPGNMILAQKPLGKRNWQSNVSVFNVFAGFPHLYYLSNLDLPINFLKKIKKFSKNYLPK